MIFISADPIFVQNIRSASSDNEIISFSEDADLTFKKIYIGSAEINIVTKKI